MISNLLKKNTIFREFSIFLHSNYYSKTTLYGIYVEVYIQWVPRNSISQGFPTYGPRAGVRPAKGFCPARQPYIMNVSHNDQNKNDYKENLITFFLF